MKPQSYRSALHAGARTLGSAFVVVTLLAAMAMAQSAGVVATLDGTVEVGRAGVFSAAAIGSSVEVGDTIRTGRPGRVRIALRDESVVNVGDDSQIVIDEQVFDPAGGEVRSVLELVRGKARSIVSEHYREPQAVFEVKTKTAVSGVRGTDFIMVYDRETDVTQVVGVSGLVDVNGTIDLTRYGVVVGAQEITEIKRGGYPTPPRRLDETTFRQYLDGLEFIGFGLPESLQLDNPLFAGAYVPPDDRVRVETSPSNFPEDTHRWEGPQGPGPNVPDVVVDPPFPIPAGDGDVGIEF